MKIKYKIAIISIISMLVLSIIGLAIGLVLVAQQANLNNSMTISYTANNVDVSITASAKRYETSSDTETGTVLNVTQGSKTSDSITVEINASDTANDIESKGSIIFQKAENITANGRVVYTFAITNTANLSNTRELKVEATVYDTDLTSTTPSFKNEGNVRTKIGSGSTAIEAEELATTMTENITVSTANIGGGESTQYLVVVMGVDDTTLDVSDYALSVQLRFAYAKSETNPTGIGQDDWDGSFNVHEYDFNPLICIPDKNVSEEDRIVHIYTAKDLAAIAFYVNAMAPTDPYHGFRTYTFLLESDIDLKGYDWTPIGYGYNSTHPSGYTPVDDWDIATTGAIFFGSFDGQGHTIKNLKIRDFYGGGETETGGTNGSCAGVGLFGNVNIATSTIKNINIANADVAGNNYVGGLIGYAIKPQLGSSEGYNKFRNGYIENCHITDSVITGEYANDDEDGAKAGALIGYAFHPFIYNCTSNYSSVKSTRDSGQVIGCISYATDNPDYTYDLININAKNVIVTTNPTNIPSNYTKLGNKMGERPIGRNDNNAVIQYLDEYTIKQYPVSN